MSALAMFVLCFLGTGFAIASGVSDYDVTWDSPSPDSSGSTPLGNGDVGVNVWMESSGDLLFYIGKTDSWSECARLLKIGRVRVSFSPNRLTSGAKFSQTLRLNEGAVEFSFGEPELRILVWVDANHPEIRVEAESESAFEMTAKSEIWRTETHRLEPGEITSAYGMAEAPHAVEEGPDEIVAPKGRGVAWFHRNCASIWPETMSLQGMGDWAATASDPLMNRTFGALMRGKGFDVESGVSLRSKGARKRHEFSIYCLTAQTATREEWVEKIAGCASEMDSRKWVSAWDAHCSWWADFWRRSWIRVSGAKDADVVSRGYVLQRFISACGGRGAMPIKFNGSIFTVEAREKKKKHNADFREWGGPYWFQNTRLPYWPMFGSGDFEMTLPLFKMFTDSLPFALARTRTYFDHDGAFFPETMYFWGAYANDNYGWARDGKKAADVDNKYIRWHWEGQLELLALMLDYYDYTRDEAFLKRTFSPMADAVFTFFDKHYARDDSGKLLMKPGQALETWQNVVNPLPEIAGLRFLLERSLSIHEGVFTMEQRNFWRRLLNETPDIPMKDGILSSAGEILSNRGNSENPELYAVFPFRLYGVGKPDLDMARRTYERRDVKGNNGWRQDDTQAAFLGLTDQARKYVAERFANKHEGSRFPAFWGPNFDWIPDQDHGANGVMALQTMLMQTEGEKILLFPAWPKDWDVDFKLHAPNRTTVEGRMRSGVVSELKVDPPEREKDVEVLLPEKARTQK
jgi:hypothetical protein